MAYEYEDELLNYASDSETYEKYEDMLNEIKNVYAKAKAFDEISQVFKKVTIYNTATALEVKEIVDELDGTNDAVNFTNKLDREGLYDKHIETQENFKRKSTKKETSDDFVSWAWSNQETGGKESPYGVIEKIAKYHGIGKGSE